MRHFRAGAKVAQNRRIVCSWVPCFLSPHLTNENDISPKGVCYPVQSRTRPRRHLLSYLAPVAVFAVGMNVPRAFESNIVRYTDRASNETLLSVAGREWTNSELYTHYYKVWSNLVLTTVIPLAVLVVCNVGIFVTLRRSRKTIRRSAANGEFGLFKSLYLGGFFWKLWP